MSVPLLPTAPVSPARFEMSSTTCFGDARDALFSQGVRGQDRGGALAVDAPSHNPRETKPGGDDLDHAHHGAPSLSPAASRPAWRAPTPSTQLANPSCRA